MLESLGSELYAHFSVTSDEAIESAELRELAQDAGGGEIPMEGGEGRIVARLDPASEVKQGEEVELWVDATRLQLFDPERRAQPDGGLGRARGGRGRCRRSRRRAPEQAGRYFNSRRSFLTIVSSS